MVSLKRSLLGGDLAGKAAANGWAGVIVNGAVRDVAELEAEALGVLALALGPSSLAKEVAAAGCVKNLCE